MTLLAVRGELTMAELSKKFDIHANLITQWKTQLLQNVVTAFDGSSVKTEGVDVEKLHAKIGQLTLENELFLKGARARRWPERKAMSVATSRSVMAFGRTRRLTGARRTKHTLIQPPTLRHN